MIVDTFFGVLVGVLIRVAAFPLEEEQRGMKEIPSLEALKFMKKYGYLEEGDGNSEALFTEEGLEEIIKSIQKFGAIEQTGKLDNATMKLMEHPRCGVPDIIRGKRSKRFILGPSGWNKRNISFFIANWPHSLSEQEVAKNIMLSLDLWGRYGRLRFTRAYDPSADIIVAFGSGYHGDRYPFDGPGNVLAHAFFPYEMNSYGGDIHFDNDEKWTTKSGDEDGIDFMTVAVHELGHSLGLAHSHVPSSVMFPYYQGKGSQVALDYDDILAMYELYTGVILIVISVVVVKRKLEGDDIEEHPTTKHRPYWRDEDYTTKATTEQTTTTTEEHRTTKQTTTTTEVTTEHFHGTKETTTEHFHGTTPTSTVNYEGDSESVDDHKNHDPRHGIPPTNSPSLPDICQGNFDAVGTIRNELFIFKDEYVWRLRRPYDLVPGYPVPLQQMFPKFPKAIKKIDAVYERPDGMIILFTGMFYWVYDGTYFIDNSPLSIKRYGFPNYVDYIDAAQIWAKNGKTYFYRNDVFWRYNETSRTMDPGYPKHMERWRGVPENLDAATTWKGVTYFFKGKCYWKFDNDWVIITESSPLPTPQTWLGCPKEEIESCEPNNDVFTNVFSKMYRSK